MIRMVITDVDGVLTDGTVLVMPDGAEVCRYSRYDGQAIADMKAAGIEVVLVSKDADAHERRASKLGVGLQDDSGDRCTAVDIAAMEAGIPMSEVCYVGDAQSDVAALQMVHEAGGLAAYPLGSPAHFAAVAAGYATDGEHHFGRAGIDVLVHVAARVRQRNAGRVAS